MSRFSTVLIQGLGLIGGSFARCIQGTLSDTLCIGVDRNPETIDFALKEGLVQVGYTEMDHVNEKPDLAVFCTPLTSLKSDIIAASQQFNHKMILTDVGSVKSTLQLSPSNLRDNHEYVPGHPMAGTEHTGIAFSSKTLLKGATHLLIKPQTEAGYAVADWVKQLGLNPVWVTAEEHDQWVAVASHIPYLLASLAVSLTEESANTPDDPIREIVSSGFRDTSRVASMAPEWGVSVCEQNKKAVLEGLNHLTIKLEELKDMVSQTNFDALQSFLTRTKCRRDDLFR